MLKRYSSTSCRVRRVTSYTIRNNKLAYHAESHVDAARPRLSLMGARAARKLASFLFIRTSLAMPAVDSIPQRSCLSKFGIN